MPRFVGMGRHAPQDGAPRDHLFLDTGNDLRPGVIDHHQLTATAAGQRPRLRRPVGVHG